MVTIKASSSDKPRESARRASDVGESADSTTCTAEGNSSRGKKSPICVSEFRVSTRASVEASTCRWDISLHTLCKVESSISIGGGCLCSRAIHSSLLVRKQAPQTWVDCEVSNFSDSGVVDRIGRGGSTRKVIGYHFALRYILCAGGGEHFLAQSPLIVLSNNRNNVGSFQMLDLQNRLLFGLHDIPFRLRRKERTTSTFNNV